MGPQQVSAFDRFLVRAVSRQPQGSHDVFFRRLSSSATKSKLWFGIAGAMATIPGTPRRAAVHGLLSLA
ncbi:hypothetical protein SB776_34955, partial [Burkholderia sp. SIMBA_045]